MRSGRRARNGPRVEIEPGWHARAVLADVEAAKLAALPPVKWMGTPPREFDILTFIEAESLIAAADAEWRTMITIPFRTGLRLGELLALRWPTSVSMLAGSSFVAGFRAA